MLYIYTYSDSTAPHPTADSTYLKLFWCLWTFLCGLSGLFWLVGAPSLCLTHPCKSTSDTEEENGGIQERSSQTEGEEMIKSEMAGNGSCRDRKQSFFFLSSYHSWGIASKRCTLLSFNTEGTSLHWLSTKNLPFLSSSTLNSSLA